MIYITYTNLNAKDCMGIKKKVLAQIRVLKKHFPKVYCTCYMGQIMYLYLDGMILEREVALTKKKCNIILKEWLFKYGITKSYIRYDWADKWFIDFLKFQKKRHIKSILEIPTYPYDLILQEKRIMGEDAYYRNEIKKYITQVVSYGEDDNIFGIPCINLQNGVDIEEHPIHKKKDVDENKIVLIAVASMYRWHGYERVIEGMKNYYENGGTRNIIFKLVGQGPESNYYKLFTEQYHLSKHVEFMGKLDGEALNKAYDDSDIAVGSLGAYKINIVNSSSIKLREYCARGIPFIYSGRDMGFTGEEAYVLNVKDNDTPINIEQVIEFFDNVVVRDSYKNNMRARALKEFVWDSLLKSIAAFYGG